MELRPALLALGIAIVGASLEGAFAGRGVRQRLAALRQPTASPPLALWVVIGLLYYVTCFGVAYRLLALGMGGEGRVAFGLLLAVMFGNAFWNFAFFRRGDLRLALGVTVAYGVAAVALLVALLGVDRLAAWFLVPYFVYLIYGMWWTCAVWRLNAKGAT